MCQKTLAQNLIHIYQATAQMKKTIPIHGSDNHHLAAFLGCCYTGRILKRLDRPETPFSLSRPCSSATPLVASKSPIGSRPNRLFL
jgi:hypothetical protein